MFTEEKYIKTITAYLSTLSSYIDTLSSVNLHDTSVLGENFCARLMNLVYGYNLKNLNRIEQNSAVIDLYDSENKISVQVTSNSKLNKVKDCLSKFVDNELFEEYDTLYIYILTEKQRSYKIENKEIKKFHFDKNKHILDKKDLIHRILTLSLPEQKEVLTLIQDNINLPKDKEVVSNEVETIINLVSLLSEKACNSVFNEDTEIDPFKKIPQRFKDSSELIDNQYFILCCDYQPILEEVKNNDEYDSVKNSKVATYLKVKSSQVLIKNNYDADKSLSELIDHVESMFKENGVSYSETAVTYFVLKHLTECNVFPLIKRANTCIN